MIVIERRAACLPVAAVVDLTLCTRAVGVCDEAILIRRNQADRETQGALERAEPKNPF